MKRFIVCLLQGSTAAIATSALLALTSLPGWAVSLTNLSQDADQARDSSSLLAELSLTPAEPEATEESVTSDDVALQAALTTFESTYGLSLRSENGEFYPTVSMQRKEFAVVTVAMLDYLLERSAHYGTAYDQQCSAYETQIAQLLEQSQELESQAEQVFAAIDESYQLQIEQSPSFPESSIESIDVRQVTSKTRSQTTRLTPVHSQTALSSSTVKQNNLAQDLAQDDDWNEYQTQIERWWNILFFADELADLEQTAYRQAPVTHGEFVIQSVRVLEELPATIQNLDHGARDALVAELQPELDALEAQFKSVEADLQALVALLNSAKALPIQPSRQHITALEAAHFLAWDHVVSITEVTDVSPTDAYYDALQRLIEYYGVDFTFSDGTFRGEAPLTHNDYVIYMSKVGELFFLQLALHPACDVGGFWDGGHDMRTTYDTLTRIEQQIELRQAALNRDRNQQP